MLPFLTALLVVPLALPAEAGAPAPCSVAHFVPGVVHVDGGVNEYVRVRFRVDSTQTGVFWGAVSVPAATSALTPPAYYGYAAARAGAVLFVEDTQGRLIDEVGGFLMYPYGIQADVGTDTLRVAAQDSDVCGSAAAGSEYTLPPGEYVMTVLAGADTPNAGAALLPLFVEVLDVTTGPLRVISEASLVCTAKAHAMALGFSSAALTGCTEAFDVEGTGYHGVFTGRFPDATHNVRWNPAVGATRTVAFFDARVEGPGEARLEVPIYVTPLGNPLYTPIPHAAAGSDSGIFGLFADIA